MDKVRAFLKVLWVQRFWVLSAVGVLAAVICWMMAAGALQEEYVADKSAILAKFSEMDAIRNKSPHGNEPINAKEREEAVKIAENVETLWRRLYDHQRKQVLYWPEVLGKEFLDYIEKRKFDSPITNALRDRYLNYIEKQFDALVAIVDAQKMDETGTVSGAFGGEGGRMAFGPTAATGIPGEEVDYLVQWLDQSSLRQKLLFGRRPTSREVWVRQEDLWVYETLLRVIANTNDERGASRPDNTAIRVIEQLQVGAEAATASNQPAQIIMPGGAAAGTEGALGEAREMGRPDAMYGDAFGGEGGDPAAADAALLQNRYVDETGAPLADASAGAGVEFRRLPVFMRLQMDPKWIPIVLVQCANAPLPIEVKRLRINPEQAAEGFDMSMGSTGAGAEGGRMGGSYRGGGYSAPMAAATPGAPTADMVTVELHGLVYIYNPPDSTVLTVPGAEDLAVADPGMVR